VRRRSRSEEKDALEELVGWARSLWVVWLMLAFLGVVFWAYRPKNRRRFEADARIPFRDEEERPQRKSEER